MSERRTVLWSAIARSSASTSASDAGSGNVRSGLDWRMAVGTAASIIDARSGYLSASSMS